MSFDGVTPILLDEAHAGDLVARKIVQEHGWAPGNYALAAAAMSALKEALSRWF